MRLYILTEKERMLLEMYLDSGETSDAFWVLLNRINKAVKVLDDDISLIQRTITKYHSKSSL